MNTTTNYRSQADAERDARVAIWGDAPMARRPFIAKGSDPLGVMAYVNGLPRLIVTATVNGKAVAFAFDHYGRRDAKPLVIA